MSTANSYNSDLVAKYHQIWKQLKANRSISIACGRYKQGKLIKAIVNIKHKEANYLKAADLPQQGKLLIARTDNTVTLTLVTDLRQITLREL